MTYWRIQPSPDQYRSLTATGLTPSEELDLVNMFKSGDRLGEKWEPPIVGLFDANEEDQKTIGDFPSFGGVVPLMIKNRGLNALITLIHDDVEVLKVNTDKGKYSALNVFSRDCLDQDRSIVQRFKTGRIKVIEKYTFKTKCLEGVHIFRLPEEIMSRTFVDDEFKHTVESNELHGLRFFKIS